MNITIYLKAQPKAYKTITVHFIKGGAPEQHLKKSSRTHSLTLMVLEFIHEKEYMRKNKTKHEFRSLHAVIPAWQQRSCLYIYSPLRLINSKSFSRSIPTALNYLFGWKKNAINKTRVFTGLPAPHLKEKSTRMEKGEEGEVNVKR